MTTEFLPHDGNSPQLELETDSLPCLKFVRNSSSSIECDSRLTLLQQNSPTSISKIRSKIKPLAPQNPSSWVDRSTGSFCFEHHKDKSYICLTCNVRLCPNCSISEAKVSNRPRVAYETPIPPVRERTPRLQSKGLKIIGTYSIEKTYH